MIKRITLTALLKGMKASLACATLLTIGLTQAQAQHSAPIVVELFTSQGCSSCPPADYTLSKLAKRKNVIALAYHVDYWDYMGWKDTFSKPQFTNRQKWYAKKLSAKYLYTPQMIIAGQTQLAGSQGMEAVEKIDQLAARRDTAAPIKLQKDAGRLLIEVPKAQKAGQYLVQLIRYIPQRSVAILRGENAGATATYTNIVTDATVLHHWQGQDTLRLSTKLTGSEPSVILVQNAQTGHIINAAKLR